MKSKLKSLKQFGVGIAFLAPNILGFLAFTAIPLVISMIMAFTDWNLELHNIFRGGAAPKFVGFDNFVTLFTDVDFGRYLVNTIFLMIGLPFGMAGSLCAALLLNNDLRAPSKRFKVVLITSVAMICAISLLMLAGMQKSAMTILIGSLFSLALIGGTAGGQSVYRTLFYFPCFTSGVATYILWKRLYSPDNGPINYAIRPMLQKLVPLCEWMTPHSAAVIGVVLFILLTLIYLYFVGRKFKSWRDGETGTLSLFVGLAVLTLIPVFSLLWCRETTGIGEKMQVHPYSWMMLGQYNWALIVMLAAIALAWGSALYLTLFTRRPFTCVADKNLGGAIILDGLLMVLGFALAGLIIVIQDMPSVDPALGIPPPKWLADYYWAKPAIIIMGIWGAIGSNNMLLYLAGLSGISPELYEAADIDGASGFQRFWNITWPQLANVTFFVLIMGIIGGLQGGFEMARTMTQGGPAGATTTLSYYIYTEGFNTGRMGYASAVAWTLFGMVFLVTLFNWKFGNRYTNE